MSPVSMPGLETIESQACNVVGVNSEKVSMIQLRSTATYHLLEDLRRNCHSHGADIVVIPPSLPCLSSSFPQSLEALRHAHAARSFERESRTCSAADLQDLLRPVPSSSWLS
ncbi:hypothetical protein L596_001739 [Steinernema carpocapsae]|uniref:Uncharacterized protein n=1 Tax=Steinernema carpocapsae TaxID=34508 RepID=A0A4U8UPT6_STECR|nr:hypothetical protein L596_001739 [Steinernema carpocapsae]